MNRLKEIRQLLGFTQFEIAAYLGVSRSTVNLTEIGLRSLPGPALMKISNIEMELVQLSSNSVTNPETTNNFYHSKSAPQQMSSVTDFYTKKIETCRFNIYKLQKSLGKMQLAYHNSIKGLEVIGALFSKEGIDVKPKDKVVNDMIRYKAQKVCLDNSPVRQALIKDEIRAEQARVTVYEQALRKYDNNMEGEAGV